MVRGEKLLIIYILGEKSTLLKKSCIILKNFETSSAIPGFLEGSLGWIFDKIGRVFTLSGVLK